MPKTLAATGWMLQASRCIRQYWWIKLPATPAGMAVFFVGYFWLLRHPKFPVTVMPVTRLDDWIRFEPWSIALYASLWIYISLVPLLLQSWHDFRMYLRAVVIMSLIGFVIFFFWPTAVPPAAIDWARYPSVAFLKSVDASGNACPSLHVAFSVLTCLWLDQWLRQVQVPHWTRVVNIVWCLAIVYSTMATKQHVAIDTVAGAALGLLVTVPHLYRLRAWSLQRRKLECD